MLDAKQAALFEKLQAFQFEAGPTSLTFADRLAKENGWRFAYAQRVIEEYKRFLLLAMCAGHPASPSDAVDQAWHLHLVYTRSYWDDLCAGVLGRPLHHGPTLGGAAEQAKHNDWYERTFASYRAFFEAEPPADIWPPLAAWQQTTSRYERVDRERYWLLPKLRLPRIPKPHRAGAVGLMALPVLATLNPLDMQGPQFLLFFIVMFAVALALGIAVRMWSGGEEPQNDDDLRLSVIELAFLNGGQKQMTQAVVAGMLHEETLKLRREKHGWLGLEVVCLRAVKEIQPGARQLAQLLHKEAGGPNGVLLTSLASVVAPYAERVKQSLEDRGLLAGSVTQWKAAAPMALVLLVGVVKLGVGMWRDKPVGLLIAGCAIALVAMLLLAKAPRLSRKGRQVVSQWKSQHAHLEGGSAKGSGLSAPEMAMAVAMFGIAATGPVEMQELRKVMGPGNTSSSCGSSCGGGGGGCGGGCGGGGCGGCGGGGD